MVDGCIRNDDLNFMSGGGEMGELTRSKDWLDTSVGIPETWPQSLRSVLGILLNSKFPMFLWWGQELTCFYNDAYRPSLGQNGKHPQILGMPAAEAWPEIWDTIKPLIDQVLKTGEATWSEDQLIPIYRNGKLEDVYWTFSYSAVNNEEGRTAGVLVTCTETTEKMEILRLLEERNEQLEFTIEAAELGTWDYNPLTNKFSANARLKEWFGLPPDGEIDLEMAINGIAAIDKERVTIAIQRALDYTSEGKYDVEYTIVNPDTSEEIAVHAKGRAWFDAKKAAYRFNGTLENITDQKIFTQKLEKQVKERTHELTVLNESLRRSEERYHLMVGEVQDYAIIYLGREGVIENWNAGAEKIKGYKADEIIGKSFSVFYPEEDREKGLPWDLLDQAGKTGRVVHEGWRIKKDGRRFWANVVITAIHNEKNELIGFSKVTHDLTDKKDADDLLRKNAEELKIKNDHLSQTNKELEAFTYISSHDLQEPLRKIQTFASWILEKESENISEKGREHFQRIQLAAERMQVLINDLLTYSRTSSTEKKIESEDLNQIIEEFKTDFSYELELKGARIETGNMDAIHIIPFQFRQLLHNLVSNSLKFASTERTPVISIRSEKGTGKNFLKDALEPETYYCHISISDNGIGFDPKYNEKIFGLFQRLHSNSEFPGTGIGLAIVKKIVDNHNGIITASGRIGQGVTFDIYLPYVDLNKKPTFVEE